METEFKRWCVENHLTARMVEEKTGIKMRTIQTYFNGSRSPSKTTRKILREKLSEETRYLFE